jgi:hypothetical protein
MTFTTRITCVLTVLLAAAYAPAPTHAQDAIVYPRVRVDLTAAAPQSTLPFSEPFFMTSKAPEGLREVQGWYRVSSGRRGPKNGAVECTPREGRALAENKQRTLPSGYDSLAWRAMVYLKPDSVYLPVRPLRGGRSYDFCFHNYVTPPTDTLTAFRARARRAIDAAVRAANVTDLQPAALAELRDSIRSAITAPTGTELVWVTGGLLDPGGTNDAILRELLLLQDPLDHRENAIAVYRAASASTARALQGLSAATAGLRFSEKLDDPHRPPGVSDAEMAVLRGAVLLLARPPAGYLDLVANGTVPLNGLTVRPSRQMDVGTVWKQEETVGQLERLTQTQQTLARLRMLLVHLGSRPAELRAMRLTPNDLDQLLVRTEAVSSEIVGVSAALLRLNDALALRETRLDEAVKNVGLVARESSRIVGSSIQTSIETRARQFVTVDLGVLYAPGLDEAEPYTGLSFTFHPVNKRIPQTLRTPLLDRLSLVVGLTTGSVSKEEEYDDLVADRAGVAGVGVRFFDFLRATAGGLVVRDLGGSALDPDRDVRVTPFYALSFDIDVQRVLGSIGKLW